MIVNVIADWGHGDEIVATFDDWRKARDFQIEYVNKNKNKPPTLDRATLQVCRVHVEEI